MSEPTAGTVEWFLERGVPEHKAEELAAIEAGGHACVPPSEPAADPVVGVGELNELSALAELDTDV